MWPGPSQFSPRRSPGAGAESSYRGSLPHLRRRGPRGAASVSAGYPAEPTGQPHAAKRFAIFAQRGLPVGRIDRRFLDDDVFTAPGEKSDLFWTGELEELSRVRREEDLYRTGPDLTSRELAHEREQLAQEVGMESALRLLNGQKVDGRLFVLQEQESEHQDRSVGDLLRLVPDARCPPVLKDESVPPDLGLWTMIHIGDHRNSSCELLGQTFLFLSGQARKDVDQVASVVRESMLPLYLVGRSQ